MTSSQQERKKVVVAGTFDILHPGHAYLIQQAQKLGRVTVIVSRDSSARRIKGDDPVIPQDQRLYMVSCLKGVAEAVLGNEGSDYFAILEEIRPDYLLLGPDQKFDPAYIETEMASRGVQLSVRRVEECCEDCPLCRSSKIKEKIARLFNERDS